MQLRRDCNAWRYFDSDYCSYMLGVIVPCATAVVGCIVLLWLVRHASKAEPSELKVSVGGKPGCQSYSVCQGMAFQLTH